MKSDTSERNAVDARPTKAFFVDMLTKDIGLVDCVLDLIDNSLHSHIRRTELDVTSSLWDGTYRKGGTRATIKISISPTEFVIEDDCGGISIEDARRIVFRLGAVESDVGAAGLGVYGVGMKRAIFKIGNRVVVASHTETEEFHVDIDVNEWMNKKDKNGEDLWYFDLTDAGPRKATRGQSPGTTIKISEFRAGVKEAIKIDVFKSDLRERVAKAYALFLKSGVRIEVNREPVVPILPEVGTSGAITPFKQRLKEDDIDILVISGIIADAHDSAPAGWYVFCNGRMVIDADRSARTGWGREFAEFHPKYNSFVGYLSFRSDNPSKLPWTTTKRDVVIESRVYQSGLGEVVSQTGKVLSFLNRAYSDEEEGKQLTRELRDNVTTVPLDQLPARELTFSVRVPHATKPTEVNILYRKPIKEIQRIRDHLGKPGLPARRIGELTFNYYLEKECD